MTSVHSTIEVVKKTLKELLPEQKPEEQEELLRLLLNNIDEHAEKKPTLTINMKELKLHIEKFVDNHLFEKEFETEFKKTIQQYTKDLSDKEKADLKKEVEKDMKKMREKGMNFKKNPKALEVMMKLLVLKHCLNPPKNHPGLERKLKVDPTIEMQNNLSKLKMEYMRLLKELEKTDPKLVLELKKVMKDVFRDIDKKIESQEELKEEITKLFRVLIELTNLPKEKEFKDLPPEDKVKIITQGSKDGQFGMIPRNDVDMPNDIIVFPKTPAAAEKEAPEARSSSDLGKTPTPSPYDKQK